MVICVHELALQSSFTGNQALTHEPPGIFLGLTKNNYEHDFRYFKLLRIKNFKFSVKNVHIHNINVYSLGAIVTDSRAMDSCDWHVCVRNATS